MFLQYVTILTDLYIYYYRRIYFSSWFHSNIYLQLSLLNTRDIWAVDIIMQRPTLHHIQWNYNTTITSTAAVVITLREPNVRFATSVLLYAWKNSTPRSLTATTGRVLNILNCKINVLYSYRHLRITV